MSREVRVTTRAAVFPPNHKERNPLYRLTYAIALSSQRLRAFILKFPPSRVRTAVAARFFQRLWEEASSGNLDPTLRLVHSDVYFELPLGLGAFRGRAGVRQAWASAFGEVFHDGQLLLVEFIDAGNGAFVQVLQAYGRGAQSGIALGGHLYGVWTVRNGVGTHARFYPSKDEALKAAGLSE